MRDGFRDVTVERAAFLACALGLTLWGYPLGVTAVAVLSPEQLQRSVKGVGAFDVETTGALVASHGAGALLGAMALVTPRPGGGASWADASGRRKMLRASAVIYGIASLGMSVTPIGGVGGRSVGGERLAIGWFMFFRTMYGFACGTCFPTTYAYVGETTSTKSRGRMLVALGVVEMIGELFGDFTGLALERMRGAWRILLALPMPVAFAYYNLVNTIPESPRWLVLRATNEASGRVGSKTDAETGGVTRRDESAWTYEDLDLTEARRAESIFRNDRASTSVSDVLFRRRKKIDGGGAISEVFRIPGEGEQSQACRDEIERELRSIADVIIKARKETTKHSCAAIANAPSTRRAMTIAFGLTAFNALSGAPALSFFAKHVFEMTGHSPTIATSMTLGYAFAKLAATVAVCLTLEHVGRRRMLTVGVGIQALACVILAFVFDGVAWIEDPRHAVSFQILSGFLATTADFCVYACGIGHALGFWALAVPLSNEVCPLRARAMILAINSAFNWALQTLAMRFFPVMMKHPGLSYTFGSFAFCLITSLAFIRAFVPETKGRTLERIETAMTEERTLSAVVRRLARERDGEDKMIETASLLGDDRDLTHVDRRMIR